MSVHPPDPSPAPPLPRFRDLAIASGLVQPAVVAAAESELRLVLAAATADPKTWDQALADKLVAYGLLTRFQARELLAGRRRFHLGQYTVLDEIGRGGMGQVFRAEHVMMGREVALKVLPRAKATPEYEAAFRREIRVLARLDHENLVRALDAGHDAKVYYLVTELVPGLDLRRQVQRYGPLNENAAASVITQAARGLDYAHEKGLVHRDVKPGNLLVTQDGRVKVLDLGLAGSTLDAETVSTGRVVGTIDYMAPEQIRTPDAVGPAADVYGLGCTLYFTLSGQVPFPGGTRKEKARRQLSELPVPLAEVAPHVDPGLCLVVEAMMNKQPDERIGTAAEVIDALRPWTPRTLVPMSRTPVAGDGLRPAAADRVQPPPLPDGGRESQAGGEASRLEASSSPSVRATEAAEQPWPVLVDPEVEDFTWLPAAGTPVRRTAVGLGRSAGWRALDRQPMAVRLAVATVLAAIGGLAFGWFANAVAARLLEADEGVSLPVSPGWLGFLFLLAVQVAALFGRRRRR